MSLPLADARSVMQSMKTKYQMFDRLEEAIVQAERAEQLTSELNAKRDDLEKINSSKVAEIATLEEQKNAVLQSINDAKSALTKFNQEALDSMEQTRNDIATEKSKHLQAIDEMNKEKDAVVAAHKAAIAWAAEEETAAKGRIDKLNEAYAAIKAKVAAL